MSGHSKAFFEEDNAFPWSSDLLQMSVSSGIWTSNDFCKSHVGRVSSMHDLDTVMIVLSSHLEKHAEMMLDRVYLRQFHLYPKIHCD